MRSDLHDQHFRHLCARAAQRVGRKGGPDFRLPPLGLQLADTFLGMLYLATARYWIKFVHAA